MNQSHMYLVTDKLDQIRAFRWAFTPEHAISQIGYTMPNRVLKAELWHGPLTKAATAESR